MFVRFVPAVVVLAASAISAAPAVAQSNRVVMVEEHWELQLGQPDTDRSAPQTTMVMSPTGDLSGAHFLFTLNHSSAPEPGGMQVQQWSGDELVQEHASSHTAALEHSQETVHWVQRLTLNEGSLNFQVLDGEGETWATFGGEDLSLSTPTELTSLNSYRPAVSLNESQVSYAENRVNSLTLTKLVWVTEDGEVHEHDAPIPIDTTVGD